MLPVAVLVLLEAQPSGLTLRQRLWDTLNKWVPLALIPLGYIAFELYRRSVGLPPLVRTYASASYHFFVTPPESVVINARYFIQNLPGTLINVDFLSMAIVPALIVALALAPRQRRLSLLAYTGGYFLVFVSKVNWRLGTGEVLYSISVGRYALALFPLTVLIADWVRTLARRRAARDRIVLWTLIALGFGGLLIFSAAMALGAGPN